MKVDSLCPYCGGSVIADVRSPYEIYMICENNHMWKAGKRKTDDVICPRCGYDDVMMLKFPRVFGGEPYHKYNQLGYTMMYECRNCSYAESGEYYMFGTKVIMHDKKYSNRNYKPRGAVCE